MELSTLDYSLIIVFFSVVLGIGIYVPKKSGKNSSGFSLGYIGTNFFKEMNIEEFLKQIGELEKSKEMQCLNN